MVLGIIGILEEAIVIYVLEWRRGGNLTILGGLGYLEKHHGWRITYQRREHSNDQLGCYSGSQSRSRRIYTTLSTIRNKLGRRRGQECQFYLD